MTTKFDKPPNPILSKIPKVILPSLMQRCGAIIFDFLLYTVFLLAGETILSVIFGEMPSMQFHWFIGWFIFLLVRNCYFYCLQTTPGMSLYSLTLVDADTLEPASLKQIMSRTLFQSIFILSLTILVKGERMTIYDRITRTAYVPDYLLALSQPH